MIRYTQALNLAHRPRTVTEEEPMRESIAQRFIIMMRSTGHRMEAVSDDTVHVFADPQDPAVERSVRATLDIMKVPAEIAPSGEDFTVTLRRNA